MNLSKAIHDIDQHSHWKWVTPDNPISVLPEVKSSQEIENKTQFELLNIQIPQYLHIPMSDIIITMSKPFTQNNLQGWTWHKSWTLPEISIELSPLPPHRELSYSAEIIVVKHQNSSNSYINVGLEGVTVLDFSNLKCQFSGLKMKSTSFKHGGLHFQLLIQIFLKNENYKNIITQKVSPNVYVDSRNTLNQKMKSMYLDNFNLFAPGELEKILVKKLKKSKSQKAEFIDSSIKGLLNYFGSPNIRFKIKHPIFLALKFHSCIQFHIVKTLANNRTTNYLSIIDRIQISLQESCDRKEKQKEILNNYLFYFYINLDPFSSKSSEAVKVRTILKELQLDTIKIVTNLNHIPKDALFLSNLQQLKQDYIQYYQSSLEMGSKQDIFGQQIPQSGSQSSIDDPQAIESFKSINSIEQISKKFQVSLSTTSPTREQQSQKTISSMKLIQEQVNQNYNQILGMGNVINQIGGGGINWNFQWLQNLQNPNPFFFQSQFNQQNN